MASLALADGRLDQNLCDQYWRDGFLHPIRVMSEDCAATERARFEAMEATWLNNGLPKALNIYKRLNSHIVMPQAAEIARNEAILNAVESVLGPDILLYSAEWFVKEPQTKQIVSMHQDLTYWGLGAVDGLVTAWLALSPATRASGCMDFVAGSHKNAILPHVDRADDNNLLSRGQEVQVDVQDADKTAIELRPGEISLHHGLTIHGSGPNVSDDRRIGLVFRFVRPDIAQQVGDTDFAMLVRGKDDLGNFTHVPQPSTEFAPDAIALHEAIRVQQAAVMMKGAQAKSATGMYE